MCPVKICTQFQDTGHNSPAHQRRCTSAFFPSSNAGKFMQEFTNLQKFTRCTAITSNYCGIMYDASEESIFDRIGLTSFTNLSLASCHWCLKG